MNRRTLLGAAIVGNSLAFVVAGYFDGGPREAAGRVAAMALAAGIGAALGMIALELKGGDRA